MEVRYRALAKKIRQCEELEAKKKQGATLDKWQQQKLRKKMFLKAELRALTKEVTGEDAPEDESEDESDDESDDE
jgi:hypothetical protein